ncbi:hypothetical protein [Gordonia sp. FQ]|uniref:hypothetical protein n=1 Tax=Gordonia sp. FQ TaxID=3446634 RepID=UPI003F82F564
MSIRNLGPAVLIEGEQALKLLKFVARAGVHRLSYNGMNTRAAEALYTTAANALTAAASDPGPADQPHTPDTPESEPTDLIDAASAAQILRCSTRHVRRLARDLDGTQLPHGAWTFRRGTVEEYAAAKHDPHIERTT